MAVQPSVRHQMDSGDGGVGREPIVDELEPGRWLPLRDAVREIGSLERRYRLAQDGELRSREWSPDQIEIWVADREQFGGAPPGVRGVTQSTDPTGPHGPELASQITAPLAPVVENHERYLHLARENGALSERVPALERELQALREVSASDKQALEALIGANVALTELLQLRILVREGEPRRRHGRGLRLWLWLSIIASLATAVVVIWFMGSLRFPFV
jgi:hypothetical protein